MKGFYNYAKQDVLKVGFGETATNAQIVKDASARLAEIKASIVPNAAYMSHLMEVAGMVWGCFAVDDPAAETTVSAALLHDAIKDQPEKSPRERIGMMYGQGVLDLVEELTEWGADRTEKAPWEDRKLRYLDHIQEMSTSALLISVCDKLQSARELKRQVRRQGDVAYSGFVKEASLSERKGLVLWFHWYLVSSYRTRLTEIAKDLKGPIIAAIEALVEEFEEVVGWLESQN